MISRHAVIGIVCGMVFFVKNKIILAISSGFRYNSIGFISIRKDIIFHVLRTYFHSCGTLRPAILLQ